MEVLAIPFYILSGKLAAFLNIISLCLESLISLFKVVKIPRSALIMAHTMAGARKPFKRESTRQRNLLFKEMEFEGLRTRSRRNCVPWRLLEKIYIQEMGEFQLKISSLGIRKQDVPGMQCSTAAATVVEPSETQTHGQNGKPSSFRRRLFGGHKSSIRIAISCPIILYSSASVGSYLGLREKH